jgi:hypothetical protein
MSCRCVLTVLTETNSRLSDLLGGPHRRKLDQQVLCAAGERTGPFDQQVSHCWASVRERPERGQGLGQCQGLADRVACPVPAVRGREQRRLQQPGVDLGVAAAAWTSPARIGARSRRPVPVCRGVPLPRSFCRQVHRASHDSFRVGELAAAILRISPNADESLSRFDRQAGVMDLASRTFGRRRRQTTAWRLSAHRPAATRPRYCHTPTTTCIPQWTKKPGAPRRSG